MSGSSIEAVWALKELKTSEGERLMSVSISCVEDIQPDILGAMKARVNQSALIGMYRDLFVGQFQPPCATPWLPLGIRAYYRTISFLPVKIVINWVSLKSPLLYLSLEVMLKHTDTKQKYRDGQVPAVWLPSENPVLQFELAYVRKTASKFSKHQPRACLSTRALIYNCGRTGSNL